MTVVTSSQTRTIATVAMTAGLSAALIWLSSPGIWWHVIRWAFYLPILLTGTSYGPLPGLASGVGASLLCAGVAASRGMGNDSWLLAPDFAVVGLLGGFSKVWRRSRQPYSAHGRGPWSTAGWISEPAINFDLNPLASIESAAGLLAQGDTPAALRQELVDIVLKECEHLSGSIRALLERCRVAPPPDQQADVNIIIEAAAQEAEFVLSGRGVTVRQEVAVGMPPIQCNPDQIRSLLMSLVINAVESAVAGKQVVLNARAGDDGVILEVKSQGGSFIRWAANHFFGSRPGTAAANLAVTYEIVHQYGGKITRTRNIRKGLQFSVWLPLRRNRSYGIWQGAGRGG